MKPRLLHLSTDRDAWERQAGEGEKTYAHFAFYRDMGRSRTLAQAAHTLALNASYLRELAAAHQWTERAGAWDREADRLYVERVALLRRDMAEQDARLATSFLAKAIQRLQRIDVDDLGPGDLVRWCEFATKLRRTAYGDPEPVAGPVGTAGAVDGTVDYASLTPTQRLTRMTQLRDELDRRITAAAALQGG